MDYQIIKKLNMEKDIKTAEISILEELHKNNELRSGKIHKAKNIKLKS